MNDEMNHYFEKIQNEVNRCYGIAEKARKKGLDPELVVESPQAKDLAGRVEKLVGPIGVAEVIRKLKNDGKSDDEIAFQVVSDILDQKIGKIKSLDERVERAIRVGLAIKTMGVVSAPLEGISKIKIREDQQGQKYLSLYFAGPIRAAGGTTAALCVLIADYVRKKSNIPRYIATEGETGRYVEEVKLYDRRVHLQYPSSNDEIRFAVQNLPVEINGDSTEDEEVSAFRNLPRVETNNIRGGACLVLNDGILLKASKLLKITKSMKLEGWDWLGELKKIAQKEEKKEGDHKTNEKKNKDVHLIPPNSKYVADIIAGRPVFSHPSQTGGHRIRYGKSRNTGLAAGGMHPATLAILDDFVAIGTQLRIERPGKSTSVCPVDSIEPPIVKLESGDVIRVSSYSMGRKVFPQIQKVLFLGDILFGFGEFAENNHVLIPSGYVEEWWALELKRAVKKEEISEKIKKYIDDPFNNTPTAEEAINISKKYDVPLHPAYVDFWGNISAEELVFLRKQFQANYSPTNRKITLNNSKETKKILEKAFILHRLKDNKIHFSKSMDYVYSILFKLDDKEGVSIEKNETVFSYFLKLSSIIVRNKAPYFMGTRMGRPEKSERKSMKGIHSLFPLSDKVGTSRLVEKAAEFGKIKIDVCRKKCPKCGTLGIFNKCLKCGTHTEVQKICVKCKKVYPFGEITCPNCNDPLVTASEASFNIHSYLNNTLKNLRLTLPKKFKGIIGLTNQFKIPEPIAKGILRAKNDVLVYKTAEIRYDATDIPLTHFKPNEIGVGIKKLKELGYTHDYRGEILKEENQIVELMVQDILLSDDCANYFIKVAKFIDEELEYFYNMDEFYNVSTRDDLVGHLVVGLAPHTSAGIIGRIIGFSPARSIYAHPFWHAAKRRNCFPGGTKILVDFNGDIKRISIKELYDNYFHPESFEKQVFVKKEKNPKESIKVYSYDQETGNIITTDIDDVIKSPYYNKLIRFKLVSGRSFETTLNHPVLVYSNGEIIEKKALEVIKSDKMLLPLFSTEIKDIEEFDLINEFHKEKFKPIWNQLMIRGIKEFVKGIIGKRGLELNAEHLSINKNTLNSYYGDRDSIPFDKLLEILEFNNLTINDIPDCNLGFKRDHTLVFRRIKANNSLMKLFGYYIAEGFYRKIPEGYQVDLAVSEKDLREDMLSCIKEIFGIRFKPYVNDNRITISNRVIYYFFKDIIGFHNTARTKRIPPKLLKIPKHKLCSLLAAYFSGDGGLDICRKTVNCSSFSENLIYDLDLALLKFGIFSGISRYERNDNIEYKLKIRGVNVIKFKDFIGFTSVRKTKILNNIITIKNTRPEKTFQNHRLLGIKNIEIKSLNEKFVYSLNAKNYHTVMVNEHIITHQCDGDEDGVMLLLDPILNFSRYYLPSKIGGRMDATLVISTLLDPNEVDSEAHNVDTLFQYPLEFYEATQNYVIPSEMDGVIELVKKHLGKKEQYKSGFNIPTSNINEGPTMTAYKSYESMDEKISAQLHLAKIIGAVDAKNVAEKILSSHFTPDILGNLRKFAVQGFRCVKCNSKFRRTPISNSGRCPQCGNNIILTVNRGGIEKYIQRSIDLCKDFNLDDYTKQRMELVEEYVQSLTNNPKIKQQKLSDFF